jgi:hypothetical protein
LVSSRATDDPSVVSGTFNLELLQVAEELFDRTVNDSRDIQTAIITGTDGIYPWPFFLAQQSYLLSRFGSQELEETIRLNQKTTQSNRETVN